MASSESSLLKLELQATGENDDTWGDKANAVFQRLEEAIAGSADITITTTTITLTDTAYSESEARKGIIKLSGSLVGSQDVVVPARTKMYLVYNGTTATTGETVTIKTAGGTGVEVPNGQYAFVYCDGTNVVSIFDPSDYPAATDVLQVANNLSDVATASDARDNIGLTIGTDVQAYDADTAKVDVVQQWTAGQRGEITTVTYASTITPDFNLSNHFTVTPTAAMLIDIPSNLITAVGQEGSIFVVHGADTLTITLNAIWKNPDAPTWSATASAVDRLDYIVHATDAIHYELRTDVEA